MSVHTDHFLLASFLTQILQSLNQAFFSLGVFFLITNYLCQISKAKFSFLELEVPIQGNTNDINCTYIYRSSNDLKSRTEEAVLQPAHWRIRGGALASCVRPTAGLPSTTCIQVQCVKFLPFSFSILAVLGIRFRALHKFGQCPTNALYTKIMKHS